MTTINITDLVYNDISAFYEMTKWLQTHVGQHVIKGLANDVLICHTHDINIRRSYGIGWHLDTIDRTNDSNLQFEITLYDGMHANYIKKKWMPFA